MVEILERIVDEYRCLREEVSKIRQGYLFAMDLVTDVKSRSIVILANESDPWIDAGLVLQLGEYQFALADVHNKRNNPYSAGVVLYGLTHRRDHHFLDEMYSHLVEGPRTIDISPDSAQ